MFPVIMMSNKESAEIFGCSESLCHESSIRVGGFCAMHVDDTVLALYTDIIKNKADITKLFPNGIGNYVIVNTDLVEKANFEENEFQAVIYHEQAHLLFSHLVGKDQSGIIIEEKLELEADAYAASFFGKAVMTSALRKIINVVVEESINVLGKSPAEANMLHSDPIILKRLEALSN